MTFGDNQNTKEDHAFNVDSNRMSFYKLGGISAWILLVYCVATMAILITIGGQPDTAQEGFAMLQNDRLTGLLRLDVLSIFFMPLYYILFLASIQL